MKVNISPTDIIEHMTTAQMQLVEIAKGGLQKIRRY